MVKNHLIMRKIFSAIILCCFATSINGQENKKIENVNYLKEIDVSDIETTHLIFDNDIEYIDVGNKYFASNVIKNIVKIKFLKVDNDQEEYSNLSIITAGGLFYSFKLFFNRANPITTYKITPTDLRINQFDSREKEFDFEESCEYVEKLPSNINKYDVFQRMKFLVNGMYYFNDKIYIKMIIENKSRVDYTLGKVDFWIRTKNTNKKKLTSFQTVRVEPIFIYKNHKEIKGFNEQRMIFVFDRLVPLKNEDFVIQIVESKGGGRRGSIKLDIEDFLIK